MRNKLTWVPKNIRVSTANPQGPKMKWVPKGATMTLRYIPCRHYAIISNHVYVIKFENYV